MPHIELRVSPNLSGRVDAAGLLKKLVARLSEFETVSPASVKAYQLHLDAYAMGENAPNGFIHVKASILSGRDLETRRAMAAALHELVRQEAEPHGAGASVELCEMDRETYFK